MMDMRFLEGLCNADAIASQEDEVREILKKEWGDFCDSINYDGLGSMIFTQEGRGPVIMVAAHIDEVGFMVRTISDTGLLQVIPVGGVRQLSKFMQEVVVTTQEREKVYGILNAEYNREKEEAENLYVDLGQDTREEVLKMGIRVGDMVTYSSRLKYYANGRIASKALDDRAGCFVMGEVMKRLYKKNHPNRICYTATSSEEVGTRGAATAAEIIKPDIAIILDVACSASEWKRDYTNNRQISKGFMLVHYDKTMVGGRKLVRRIRDLACRKGICFQEDMFLNGGTDGGAIHLQGSGHPAAVLGIPLRYGHSPYSIACMEDMEQLAGFLEEFLMDFDEKACEQTCSWE